jgi:hypothetical protein
LVKAVSEHNVNSFGIKIATAGAKRESESSFKVRSLEGFVARVADVWRNRKTSTFEEGQKRVRFFYDMMTTIQIAQPRTRNEYIK